QCLEKAAALVDVASADEEANVLPGERLEFLAQFTESFGDGLGLGGAVQAEKIAVLEPDHLCGAEKGEGVERFAQFDDGFEGLPAMGHLGVDNLVVQAPEFGAPLLVDLAGVLFDGVIVVPVNEANRREGGSSGRV